MSWTIGGSSASSLKLVVASVNVGTNMVDTATLETSGAWTGSAPFAYGDWLTISADGTAVLYGMVTSVLPFASAGGTKGFRITVSGPMWHLMRAPYFQPFYYATAVDAGDSKPRSRCWIGVDPTTGERCNTKTALQHVLDCAVDVGVPITYNLDGMTGVAAPPFEVQDQTCGSVAQQLMRWHPGLYFFFQYGSGSATLYAAASSGTVTVPVGGGSAIAATAEVESRDDMVPEGIIIRWERVNTFEVEGDPSGSQQRIEEHTEAAGAGLTGPGVGVLMFTIDLAGSQILMAEQVIEARTVPDDVAAVDGGSGLDTGIRNRVVKWYSNHVPWMAAVPAAALQIEEHTRVMNLPEWDTDDDQRPSEWAEGDAMTPHDDEAVPGDLPRELLDGDIPEWANWLKAEPMLARVKVKWAGGGSPTAEQIALGQAVFGEDLNQVRIFDVQYTGTNAVSKRYRGVTKYVAAEAWPDAGLAAAVLANLNSLRYEGTVKVPGSTQYTSARPGRMLTLSGGPTGSGVVQSVAYSAENRETLIRFGFAGHLSVTDFVELQRANRTNALTANYSKDRQQSATPGSNKQTSTGSKRKMIKNTSSPDGGGGGSACPFSGKMVGADFTFTNIGTLNALEPDNMYDGAALRALPLTAAAYIILTVTTADNNVQSCTIGQSPTPPAPIPTGTGVAPGEFEIALYFVNADAQATRIIGCGSLWAYAHEALRTSNPTPDACGDPYIRHYTWRVELA